jgi:hypothetical protein
MEADMEGGEVSVNTWHLARRTRLVMILLMTVVSVQRMVRGDLVGQRQK